MNRIRKLRQKPAAAEDLDVTAFMNLMIVLVPVLLLSMTLAHTRVIELDLPWGAGAEQLLDAETMRFEVIIDADGFVVRDGREAIIKTVPRLGDAYDYRTLSLVMQELKRSVPEKRDIALLLAPDVSYQILVSVMDCVRSYSVSDNGTPVPVELFPVISLGDAPLVPIDGVARAGQPEGDRT